MARRSVLTHPVFVGAVVVLAFNDRIAKAAFPGVVTGKLSDVAGVVVVMLVVYALCDRTRLAAAITSIGFAALKLSPVVARTAAPLLGGVTRTAATDLIATAALIPVVVWLERAPPARVGSRRRLLPIGVLTVVVVSATSCNPSAQLDQIADRSATRNDAGRAVEVKTAAGWTTAFAFSDQQRSRMSSSNDGWDGVLGRNPTATPAPIPVQPVSALVLLGVALAALPMVLLGEVNLRRRHRWRRAAAICASAGAAGLMAVGVSALDGRGGDTFALIVGALSLVVLAGALVDVWRPLRPVPPPPPLLWPPFPR